MVDAAGDVLPPPARALGQARPKQRARRGRVPAGAGRLDDVSVDRRLQRDLQERVKDVRLALLACRTHGQQLGDDAKERSDRGGRQRQQVLRCADACDVPFLSSQNQF